MLSGYAKPHQLHRLGSQYTFEHLSDPAPKLCASQYFDGEQWQAVAIWAALRKGNGIRNWLTSSETTNQPGL